MVIFFYHEMRAFGAWFAFMLIGVILIIIAAIVYSQFMTVRPNPPRWPYFFLIIGIILVIVGIFLLFYPPSSEILRITDPVIVR